jgi:hypothetical protein
MAFTPTSHLNPTMFDESTAPREVGLAPPAPRTAPGPRGPSSA